MIDMAHSNNLLELIEGAGRVHTGYNLEIVPPVHLLYGTTLLQVKAVTLDYEMWTRCTGY